MTSPLQSFDIRKEWESILPGLQFIKDKTHPDWRPEDLYAACVAGRMHLFKPEAGSSDFVLLTQHVSVYSGDTYLLVFAAFSKQGDAITTFQSDIEAIARESRCKWIEFWSPRKGFEKLATRHGFAEQTRVYRRML